MALETSLEITSFRGQAGDELHGIVLRAATPGFGQR
jgi:hypothetical protein